MLPRNHPDRIQITFDDRRLVANAGLLLPATLARHLGLPELVRQRLDLGDAPGRANTSDKMMTLVASALAGGDCIDDADVLRTGGTACTLGGTVKAPSTLGTFLRSFRWGHVRQLDRVSRELLARAWQAGAGPGDGPLTIDLDSTICETYGLAKEGARHHGYTGKRGYHPLLAIAAGTGDVLMSRLREGRANTARGAAHFLRETVGRVRYAGANGRLTLRADSGFYTHGVVSVCRKMDARFSITIPVLDGVVVGLADGDLLEAIPLYPAVLVGAPEFRPDLRREPVEQVEDGRGVPAEEGPGQAEGLAANVGEDARGDALGASSPLELVNFIAYQQVEEALHPVLDVVGQWVAGWPGPVGLPQGGAAAGAGVLAAVQVGVRQGHAVLVHDLRGAVGAAGDAEGLSRLLLPYEPAPRRGPPLYDGGHPAVGQLGLLTAHHREEGAGADGEAQRLQVGDGLDDGRADAGHRHLHLPLPLGHQVRRADDEDALESRHVRRRRADEGLAGAHLADDGSAPVGLEGESRPPDGVGLRPQGLRSSLGSLPPFSEGR